MLTKSDDSYTIEDPLCEGDPIRIQIDRTTGIANLVGMPSFTEEPPPRLILTRSQSLALSDLLGALSADRSPGSPARPDPSRRATHTMPERVDLELSDGSEAGCLISRRTLTVDYNSAFSCETEVVEYAGRIDFPESEWSVIIRLNRQSGELTLDIEGETWLPGQMRDTRIIHEMRPGADIDVRESLRWMLSMLHVNAMVRRSQRLEPAMSCR